MSFALPHVFKEERLLLLGLGDVALDHLLNNPYGINFGFTS
jgi:hypothetical protein